MGGYAVAFHGHPRYTKDLDVWIDRTPENAQRLLQALDDFGFGWVGLKERDFLELEGLRANKRASGRHQDLADLENLE